MWGLSTSATCQIPFSHLTAVVEEPEWFAAIWGRMWYSYSGDHIAAELGFQKGYEMKSAERGILSNRQGLIALMLVLTASTVSSASVRRSETVRRRPRSP